MLIFIDTANISQIKEACSWGIIDGVTTNPTLLSKETTPPHRLLEKICNLVDGPVNAEVISLDYHSMVKEAEKLAKIHKNIVIKIPLTTDGLKAVKILRQKKIKSNVTLCFSPAQAILAAKAGANYLSPFIGRLDDISTPGMELIAKIRKIYDNYSFSTKIIVASIRHPLHIVESALLGADIITAPFHVLEQLIKHPLTDIGIERFLKDWKKISKK